VGIPRVVRLSAQVGQLHGSRRPTEGFGPVQSAALQGLDSLLSIVQMPGGVPVGTLAIGKAGATNAGLLAASILANSRPDLRQQLRNFRTEQTENVRQERLP